MAKAKRVGNSYKGYYAAYKSGKVWQTNRLKKLKRALKRNPENAEQINKAMSNVEYRRKTPTTTPWTATKIRGAMLFKMFQGRVPKSFINGTVPKRGEEEAYWSDINKSNFDLSKLKGANNSGTNRMFSLGTRMRTKV